MEVSNHGSDFAQGFSSGDPWMILVILPVGILACGGGDPTPAPASTPVPFNPDELKALVREAVADSLPEAGQDEGLTEEELQSLIERAVAESVQPGLTSENIEELVAVAVASSVSPGVTLQEVEEAIASALAAQSGSAAQDSLTPSGPLAIYSGRSESLVDPIIRQFGEATGIEAEVKYAGTSHLAATLLEEGINSPADVFFAQDPGGLGVVQHLLSPLPDGVLGRVPEWARSPEGVWVGLSGRARTVVYNPERVSEDELPDDVWGFVDPEWKDRIGWALPQTPHSRPW